MFFGMAHPVFFLVWCCDAAAPGTQACHHVCVTNIGNLSPENLYPARCTKTGDFMNRSIIATLLAGLLSAAPAFSQQLPVSLHSPDGQVAVVLDVNEAGNLNYSVERKGEMLIEPSQLRLRLAEGDVSSVDVRGVMPLSVNIVQKLVATKAAQAVDRFDELTVEVAPRSGAVKSLKWIFRAYDDGVAFRYVVPAEAGVATLSVRNEETDFAFGGDYACHGFNVGRFDSSHEGEFDPVRASKIREHNTYDLPLVCRTEGNAFAITEANLRDYGGLYLAGRGEGRPGVQSRIARRIDDRSLIARTPIGADGAGSPWRVIMLADRLGKLIESNLIGNLNPPAAFDTSWIRPGKTAWDWWSGPYLPPPDKGGTDMPTIRKYVDFASLAGFEYMMIDEGWCLRSGHGGSAPADADVTQAKADIDMPALVDYAKKKKVGLWLWVQWSLLDRQMDAALAQYQKWGIKGIKVDFMDRSDQQMVDYYHKLMAKAAQHQLLVDMHGAYPPTGLNRTFPNYLTQEGIMGAEYNKWSRRVTATHNVSLAFTRMLLGPLDYTPGGFRNATPANFQVINSPPQVQTTRGHGLGMFVVYESPFQMVADSPDAYANAAGFDFVRAVPTVWDETRFLAGDIDEFVAVARRKGKDWYIGAMGTEQAREITLPLGFLGEGKFKAKIYEDADTPTALNESTKDVTKADSLTLKLAPSGGAAVRITFGR
jgi:alpha-glucosidase